MTSTLFRLCIPLLVAMWLTPVFAADVVPIETLAVTSKLSMLSGRGGNVAVLNGDDGVIVVDAQYASQYEVIAQALAQMSAEPVKFLLNTHWHDDHSGGNERMQSTGAVIVAHENVRKRLSTDQFIEFFKAERPAAPTTAWPVVTFQKDVTFHLNGEEIHVFHVRNAHTDGDAVVHFKNANVVHTGDVFFHRRYPFIDSSSGGSITGMIAAVENILARIDGDTKIIPGHGALTDKRGLEAYLAMLTGTHNAIATMMVAGNNVEQIVAAQPTAAYDAVWGNSFLNPETLVRLIVDNITRATLE